MIEPDPDVAREQCLVHEIITRRVWIDAFPQRRELAPHRLGIRRTERNNDTASEGRVEKALEKAMHQPLRPCWKAKQAFAGLMLYRACPARELVVAESVKLRATRQIGQRLFIGYHDVARLHPWDVELVDGSELAERQQRVWDTAVGQFAGEAIERDQCIKCDERLELTVERPDDVDLMRRPLLLCLDA